MARVFHLPPFALLVVTLGTLTLNSARGATYHVSSGGSDKNDGLSERTAWRTLGQVNGTRLKPGDAVLLKRGDTFTGTLEPQGSGSAKAPIRLGAYGSGSRPVISAGSHRQAVRLFNQEYWEISDIETTGGTRFGIYVGGDLKERTLRHIYITDVSVHDVRTKEKPQYDAGLIVVMPSGDRMIFDDVRIRNATAFDTNQWWGIHVGWNDQHGYPSPGYPQSTRIEITNCTVHHCGGDPITVASCDGAVLERNLAYEGGLAPEGSVSQMYTPVAIWSWASSNVVVQFNEVYGMHTYGSNGADGGAFDVDWGSKNVTIQYNYAHDNEGYGAAIFAGKGHVTSNTIIRFNIFSNNDRRSGGSSGEITVYGDDAKGTAFDGIQIYNNTFYRVPSSDAAAMYVVNLSRSGSRPFLFENNLIYSEGPMMINLPAGFSSDHNLFWSSKTPIAVSWQYRGTTYASLAEYSKATGQDVHSLVAAPRVNSPTYHEIGAPETQFRLERGSPAFGSGKAVADMGTRDFFGNKVDGLGSINIGADNGTRPVAAVD
jgi:hypothetical protein